MEVAVIVALTVLCGVIMALHVVALLVWTRERRDLLNRIMAKDGSEYIRITSSPREKKESVRERRKKAWREEIE